MLIRTRRPAPNRPAPLSGAVRILTYAGLGDILGAATVAYAAAEAGHVASIGYREASYAHVVTQAAVEALPLLPLVDRADRADRTDVDLTRLSSFQWTRKGVSILDALSDQAGCSWRATPRTACLEVPAEQVARGLVGRGRYGVIAPEGHAHGAAKALRPTQVAAAAAAMRACRIRPVLVGMQEYPICPDIALDLTRRTSIPELCALAAYATAVVGAETGVAHLAAAYQTPCVWLCPKHTTPWSALCDFAPVLVLEGPTAGEVPAEAVAKAVRKLCKAALASWHVDGPDLQACGVAQTGMRAAAAAGVVYGRGRGTAVLEWHGGANGPVVGRDPSRAVLSVHSSEFLDLSPWAGVIFRQAAEFRRRRAECRRAWWVPLLSLPGVRARERAGGWVIGWHGIIHPGRGLFHLVEAFRRVREAQPRARLRIIGTLGDAVHAPAMAGWVRSLRERGVDAQVRGYWPAEELVRALSECDALCYPDTSCSAEQSAASADALGMGVPVLVSGSRKHDDVRGWCVTAGDDLAGALLRVLGDHDAYARACERARMGASFRRPDVVARQYRAAVVQALLDGATEPDAVQAR